MQQRKRESSVSYRVATRRNCLRLLKNRATRLDLCTRANRRHVAQAGDARWDNGMSALALDLGNQDVGIVPLAGKHGIRHAAGHQRLGLGDVGHLASAQDRTDWVAEGIRRRVNPGGQTAPRAVYRLCPAFFGRPPRVAAPARWRSRSSRFESVSGLPCLGLAPPQSRDVAKHLFRATAQTEHRRRAMQRTLPVAPARELPPRSPGTADPGYGFDKQTVVFGGHPAVACFARQHVLDPVPWVIAQYTSIHCPHPAPASVQDQRSSPQPSLGSSPFQWLN